MRKCDNVCETITQNILYMADNYSLVFVIFINFFGQLKDWVEQVLFLLSCPKGQVKQNVNVEACYRCTDVLKNP
jgi:hypothetical protein